jgi:hypothetical protein
MSADRPGTIGEFAEWFGEGWQEYLRSRGLTEAEIAEPSTSLPPVLVGTLIDDVTGPPRHRTPRKATPAKRVAKKAPHTEQEKD